MAQRERVTPAEAIDPLGIALGLLSGAVVYVSYHPSDSVAVEQGGALWFAALAIVIGTVTWAAVSARTVSSGRSPREAGGGSGNAPRAEPDSSTGELAGRAPGVPGASPSQPSSSELRADRLLDVLPWLLGGWMMVAAVAASPPGNLRVATNEAWVWISAAAVFTAARRLFASAASRQRMLGLIVTCAAGLAVHGLHQQWVSLPANRAAFHEDPEAVLRMAGIDAPAGSAERMVFENRLFDGGPTGTFALANSLAGVLVVAFVVVTGLLRDRWRQWHTGARTAGVAAALLCAAGLLATRSRSGVLAALLGAGFVIVIGAFRRNGFAWRHRWMAGSAVAVLVILGASLAAAVGGREFLEQAPASLAFRFQYWRSTLALALDRPWFGAGPGNFQAIYEQYREPSASEQIAEPHNFFFETLASGGAVAAALLIGLFAAGVYLVVARSRREAARPIGAAGAPASNRSRWVPLGAGAALVLVWLIGFAVGQVPDFEAHLWAVPAAVAIACGLLAPRTVSGIPPRSKPGKGRPSMPLRGRIAGFRGSDDAASGSIAPERAGACDAGTRWTAAAALAAVLVHLLVAGGWTVPGVAIHVWILAAMVCPATVGGVAVANGSGTASHRRGMWAAAAAIVAGIVLLIALRLVSIGPVQAADSAMAEARSAQSLGQFDRAETALRRALQADPWSTDPALWLADILRWRLVVEGDSPARRAQWIEAIEELLERSGKNPAVYGSVARQQLHLFQRHGRRRDLAAALKTLRTAARWAPADQRLAAQLAVAADAAGDRPLARRAAQRAARLSRLGNNIERALQRQYILEARPIGAAAARGPRLQPAERLLANRLLLSGVQAPD